MIMGFDISSATVIELFSLDGLLLQQISASGKSSAELNMGDYASSTYLLRIQTGLNCLTQKIINRVACFPVFVVVCNYKHRICIA